jgi:hypothetical protein
LRFVRKVLQPIHSGHARVWLPPPPGGPCNALAADGDRVLEAGTGKRRKPVVPLPLRAPYSAH